MHKKIGASAIKSFALLVVLGTACCGTANLAMAQDAVTPYPKMAPIDQYLMTDQSAEIALARSAAPESTSRDAKSWFLDGMVSKRRSKGRTVSRVSWDGDGLPRPILTFGTRRFASPCV